MEFDTDRIKYVLSLLNNPQDKIPLIHVTGTNGKGSVCSFLLSIFMELNKNDETVKIGTFNSPSLLNSNDCIRIQGIPIQPSLYNETLQKVENLLASHHDNVTVSNDGSNSLTHISSVSSSSFSLTKLNTTSMEDRQFYDIGKKNENGKKSDDTTVASSLHSTVTSSSIYLTNFEKQTVIAFLIFSKYCNVGIIEVGLGGLLDATNVLNYPVMTLLTSISIDHLNIIGPTWKDIIRHKLGIGKSFVPFLISFQEDIQLNQNPRSDLDDIGKENDLQRKTISKDLINMEIQNISKELNLQNVIFVHKKLEETIVVDEWKENEERANFAHMNKTFPCEKVHSFERNPLLSQSADAYSSCKSKSNFLKYKPMFNSRGDILLLQLGLPGKIQRINSALAIEAIYYLFHQTSRWDFDIGLNATNVIDDNVDLITRRKKRDIILHWKKELVPLFKYFSKELVEKGCKNAFWPGRLDWITMRPAAPDSFPCVHSNEKNSNMNIYKQNESSYNDHYSLCGEGNVRDRIDRHRIGHVYRRMICLDGAHNIAGMSQLRSYVEDLLIEGISCSPLRSSSISSSSFPSCVLSSPLKPLIKIYWVFGITRGKNFMDMAKILFKPFKIENFYVRQEIFLVEYPTPIDMPWNQCMSSQTLVETFYDFFILRERRDDLIFHQEKANIKEIIYNYYYENRNGMSEESHYHHDSYEHYDHQSHNHPYSLLIVSGSLFLISETFKQLNINPWYRHRDIELPCR